MLNRPSRDVVVAFSPSLRPSHQLAAFSAISDTSSCLIQLVRRLQRSMLVPRPPLGRSWPAKPTERTPPPPVSGMCSWDPCAHSSRFFGGAVATCQVPPSLRPALPPPSSWPEAVKYVSRPPHRKVSAASCSNLLFLARVSCRPPHEPVVVPNLRVVLPAPCPPVLGASITLSAHHWHLYRAFQAYRRPDKLPLLPLSFVDQDIPPDSPDFPPVGTIVVLPTTPPTPWRPSTPARASRPCAP